MTTKKIPFGVSNSDRIFAICTSYSVQNCMRTQSLRDFTRPTAGFIETVPSVYTL